MDTYGDMVKSKIECFRFIGKKAFFAIFGILLLLVWLLLLCIGNIYNLNFIDGNWYYYFFWIVFAWYIAGAFQFIYLLIMNNEFRLNFIKTFELPGKYYPDQVKKDKNPATKGLVGVIIFAIISWFISLIPAPGVSKSTADKLGPIMAVVVVLFLAVFAIWIIYLGLTQKK